MKVFAYRDGRSVTADVPDDSIWMNLGSTGAPDGIGLLPPIVEIDYNARTYRRHCGELEPFPERYYEEDQIQWRPTTDEDRRT